MNVKEVLKMAGQTINVDYVKDILDISNSLSRASAYIGSIVYLRSRLIDKRNEYVDSIIDIISFIRNQLVSNPTYNNARKLCKDIYLIIKSMNRDIFNPYTFRTNMQLSLQKAAEEELDDAMVSCEMLKDKLKPKQTKII